MKAAFVRGIGIPVLSVDNMRKSDRATIEGGTPGRELMRRAGQAVFDSVDWKAPVAVVCGSGNNAGDGYVIALLLHDAGIDCALILLSETFSVDGGYYRDLCRKAGIPEKIWDGSLTLTGYATVVDCLFGTGFKGEVRGAAREAVRAVNASGAYVVSVDINSGLNGDSGLAECCVSSDLTVSVGHFKTGHFLNMAKDVMKKKINCEIGIDPVDQPRRLIGEADIKTLFRPRKNFSHKGDYGYIALIGGSLKYGGAIRLAAMANAAMRAGAGVVRLAVPAVIAPAIAPEILESTLFPLPDNGEEMVFDEEKARALTSSAVIAFGMGVGTTAGPKAYLEYFLTNYTGTLALDADGLTLLASLGDEAIKKAASTLVLTPHLGEFSRLTGKAVREIQNDPAAEAEAYAKSRGVILLLKGPTTVITDGKATFLVDAGCPGMATAGSGDVLSGILSAVLANSPDPLLGTAAAAFINGRAGEAAQAEHGSVSMVAGDTVSCVGRIVRELEGV